MKDNTRLGDEQGSSPVYRPLVRRMSDVRMARAQWLRHSWYPLGAYTDLSGDPGTGKSQLLCELTAEVTGDGGEVLILSAEDSAETTLKPRLLAVGADCESVHVLPFVERGDDGEPIPINLVEHIDAFRDAIETIHPRLVWLDTLDAHAEGVNMNTNTEVRGYLRPLINLAELHKFALVGIRHWNKKDGQSAIYKGSGSVAIVAAARSAIVVGPHPSEKGIYVQASAKLNIGKRPTSLAYRIDQALVDNDGQEPIITSRITWTGAAEVSADELSVQKRRSPDGGPAVQSCAALLQVLLECGPQLTTEVEKRCLDAGHSPPTIKRARQKLKVISNKEPAFGGAWVMSLPKVDKAQRGSEAEEVQVAAEEAQCA